MLGKFNPISSMFSLESGDGLKLKGCERSEQKKMQKLTQNHLEFSTKFLYLNAATERYATANRAYCQFNSVFSKCLIVFTHLRIDMPNQSM